MILSFLRLIFTDNLLCATKVKIQLFLNKIFYQFSIDESIYQYVRNQVKILLLERLGIWFAHSTTNINEKFTSKYLIYHRFYLRYFLIFTKPKKQDLTHQPKFGFKFIC